MNKVNGICHFFQLCIPAPEPLNRFCKDFAQLVTLATPPDTQTFGSVGSNEVCLRMLEALIVGHMFLVSCTSLQVHQLDR